MYFRLTDSSKKIEIVYNSIPSISTQSYEIGDITTPKMKVFDVKDMSSHGSDDTSESVLDMDTNNYGNDKISAKTILASVTSTLLMNLT